MQKLKTIAGDLTFMFTRYPWHMATIIGVSGTIGATLLAMLASTVC